MPHVDLFTDDQERHHCALDLDKAREEKPQVYALAQWAIVWGERLRADLLAGNQAAAHDAGLTKIEDDLSEAEDRNVELNNAIDQAITKIDADDVPAAREILRRVWK